MKKLFILLSLILLFLSCKKDKLEDGKEIFIGKWNWEYSEHKYNVCSGAPPITEIITPETEGVNYSLMFLEKGIVQFYKNNSLLNQNPLIFNSFDKSICGFDPDLLDFNFHVSRKASRTNDSDYLMDGCVGASGLIFRLGFPYPAYAYPEIEAGCDQYISYFTKE